MREGGHAEFLISDSALRSSALVVTQFLVWVEDSSGGLEDA